jgi:hypothetical protein
MRPPRLWIAYCSILKVPPRLQITWWAALWRSRRPEVQALCDGFERLSTQRVVHGDCLREQAGRFCRKFSFGTVCGMISLHDHR